MSKPPTKIDPNSANKLKELYKRLEITQSVLSERTGISQNTLSKIANGKHPLTERVARQIVEEFPQVRLDWLMCRSEDYSESARFARAVAESNHEGRLLFTGTTAFATLCGYDIVQPNLNGDKGIEELLSSIKSWYKISKGATSISLSIEEMNLFENEVRDFVELKFKHLFAQKGVRLDG